MDIDELLKNLEDIRRRIELITKVLVYYDNLPSSCFADTPTVIINILESIKTCLEGANYEGKP